MVLGDVELLLGKNSAQRRPSKHRSDCARFSGVSVNVVEWRSLVSPVGTLVDLFQGKRVCGGVRTVTLWKTTGTVSISTVGKPGPNVFLEYCCYYPTSNDECVSVCISDSQTDFFLFAQLYSVSHIHGERMCDDMLENSKEIRV